MDLKTKDLGTKTWLGRADEHNAKKIRQYGWVIAYERGDVCSASWCDCPKFGEPAFGYTVGLFGLGHPELLIFGADHSTTMGVLNNVGDRIKAREDLKPGELITFDEWPHRIIVEESPNPGEIVFEANRYYRRPDSQSVPVLQLTYDDKDGRFPWEDGYASPGLQPRPGEFHPASPGLDAAA